MKKRFLEAGKIVNTHGVLGEVRIQPWADSPDFLMGFETVYIDEKPVRLLRSRVHKQCIIAQLDGVLDVNAAMRLKNKTVFIDREDPFVPEDTVFIQDILGARVQTEEGAELGVLKDVLNMPASDVYVVAGEREIMIPAVPEFILDIDPEGETVTVRLIEGM